MFVRAHLKDKLGRFELQKSGLSPSFCSSAVEVALAADCKSWKEEMWEGFLAIVLLDLHWDAHLDLAMQSRRITEVNLDPLGRPQACSVQPKLNEPV